MQHDRQRVLNFLYNPDVEPTNNRAERALRPAVIAREVSHCSKNERGAEAFAAFTSVARTAVKKSAATVTDVFHRLIKNGPEPPGRSWDPTFLTHLPDTVDPLILVQSHRPERQGMRVGMIGTALSRTSTRPH